MAWAMKQTLKVHEKMVLLVLADCHNGDNGQCNPSLTHISEQSSCGRSTVARALKTLESEGLISRDRGGKARSTKYVLNLKQWCQSGTSATAGLVPHRDKVVPQRDQLVPQRDYGSATAGHEPVIEPVKNQERTSNTDDRWSEFWSVYPRKVGKAKAVQAWSKLKPPDREIAIADVTNRARSDDQWIRDSGKFVPHASTYLNGKRWEDEWTAAEPQHDPNDTSWATREINSNDDTSWAYTSDDQRSVFDHGGAVPALVEGRRRNQEGLAIPVGRILGGGHRTSGGKLS